MSKLYELSQALEIIHSDIDEAGGELSEGLEARLDEVTLALEKKAVSIGKLVKNIHGDEVALDDEIKRLTKKKQARVNLQNRLKDYLKENMEKAGITKIANPVCQIRIQANSQPTLILDERTEWPAQFCDVIPERLELNKAKLKAALTAGEKVEGAEIHKGSHLRVG